MKDVHMKNNGKKTALLSVICVMAVLFVCYMIGQNVVLPKRMAKEG